MFLVEIEQLLPIRGEPEEVALLLDPFDRRAGRAAPLAAGSDADLGLAVVRFVADRVPAGVFGKVDVAGLRHPLPDRLRSAIMPRLGRADEIVVAALEPLDHGAEPRHGALDQLAGRNAGLGRGLLHFSAVLVGPGEKEHVVTVEPHEAGDRIGRDRLVGMADVRGPIGIGDGGRKKIAGLGRHREKLVGVCGWISRARLRRAGRMPRKAAAFARD